MMAERRTLKKLLIKGFPIDTHPDILMVYLERYGNISINDIIKTGMVANVTLDQEISDLKQLQISLSKHPLKVKGCTYEIHVEAALPSPEVEPELETEDSWKFNSYLNVHQTDLPKRLSLEPADLTYFYDRPTSESNAYKSEPSYCDNYQVYNKNVAGGRVSKDLMNSDSAETEHIPVAIQTRVYSPQLKSESTKENQFPNSSYKDRSVSPFTGPDSQEEIQIPKLAWSPHKKSFLRNNLKHHLTASCNFDIDDDKNKITLQGPQSVVDEGKLAVMEFVHTHMFEDTVEVSDGLLNAIESSAEMMRALQELLDSESCGACMGIEDSLLSFVAASHEEAKQGAAILSKALVHKTIKITQDAEKVLKGKVFQEMVDGFHQNSLVYVNSAIQGEIYVEGLSAEVDTIVNVIQDFMLANVKSSVRGQAQVGPLKFLQKYQAADVRALLNKNGPDLMSVKYESGEFVLTGPKDFLEQTKIGFQRLVNAVFQDILKFTNKPGMGKFFDSGSGKRMIKTLEINKSCLIDISFTTNVTEKEITVPHGTSSKDVSGALPVHVTTDNSSSPRREIQLTPKAKRIDVDSSATSWKFHKVTMCLEKGDITKYKAEVLVNVIQKSFQLLRGGAIAKSFGQAGGAKLQEMCNEQKSQENSTFGTLIITDKAGNLKCSKVFHVVCPPYDAKRADKMIAMIIDKILQEAHKLGASTVAMPTIGCGKLHYPPAVIANKIIERVQDFANNHTNESLMLTVVAFEESVYGVLKQQINSFIGQLKNGSASNVDGYSDVATQDKVKSKQSSGEEKESKTPGLEEIMISEQKDKEKTDSLSDNVVKIESKQAQGGASSAAVSGKKQEKNIKQTIKEIQKSDNIKFDIYASSQVAIRSIKEEVRKLLEENFTKNYIQDDVIGQLSASNMSEIYALQNDRNSISIDVIEKRVNFLGEKIAVAEARADVLQIIHHKSREEVDALKKEKQQRKKKKVPTATLR